MSRFRALGSVDAWASAWLWPKAARASVVSVGGAMSPIRRVNLQDPPARRRLACGGGDGSEAGSSSKQASRSGGRWARGVDRIHKALHLRQPITRESLRMLGGRLAADQRPSAAVADVVVCGCVQARRVRLQAVSKEGLEVRTSGRCGVCVCVWCGLPLACAAF